MDVVDDVCSRHWLEVFFEYCVGNRPCVLPSPVTDGWAARIDWVTAEGRPNLELLEKEYGHLRVPVIVDGECEPVDESFAEYIHYCRGKKDGDTLRYLKDWHFQEAAGSDVYCPPACLAPDWINRESWTSTAASPFDAADYRFVYFGVAETWTPLHSDVVASHSWSANVCGRKRWLFVPRGEEARFMKNGQLIADLRVDEAGWRAAGGFELVQAPGEIVFVPTNWHHQVHNLEDTISINHNVVNASNVGLVAEFLLSRLKDVRDEIGHLTGVFDDDEMREKERLILRADARLDLEGLSSLCRMVIDSRLERGIDVCFVCPRHEDVVQCRMGSRCCRPLPCECTTSTCALCTRLLGEYELTTAALVLHRLEREQR